METIIHQAGAIAYKKTEKGALVLLVRAKKNPSHWIFPKGHIELGESDETTGVRELAEEAGVEGIAVKRAGEQEYRLAGKLYKVTYFLVRYVSTIGEGEPGRDPVWCTAEEAFSCLAFPDSRKLLRKLLQDILG